jgi:hypothetical protein
MEARPPRFVVSRRHLPVIGVAFDAFAGLTLLLAAGLGPFGAVGTIGIVHLLLRPFLIRRVREYREEHQRWARARLRDADSHTRKMPERDAKAYRHDLRELIGKSKANVQRVESTYHQNPLVGGRWDGKVSASDGDVGWPEYAVLAAWSAFSVTGALGAALDIEALRYTGVLALLAVVSLPLLRRLQRHSTPRPSPHSRFGGAPRRTIRKRSLLTVYARARTPDRGG